MLDTHARRYLNPLFRKAAGILLSRGLTPDAVTAAAFAAGVAAGPLAWGDHPYAAVAALWTSGFLDALDGEMARQARSVSARGTLLDITSDRCVEAAVLTGLALRNPGTVLPLLVLALSFLLSLTVFLTAGALIKNCPTVKSFYYQAGLMERTEGFLTFTALILVPSAVPLIAYAAACLVLITILQRFREAWQLLG